MRFSSLTTGRASADALRQGSSLDLPDDDRQESRENRLRTLSPLVPMDDPEQLLTLLDSFPARITASTLGGVG